MTEDNRPEPPSIAGEREILAGFLDFHRLGLVKHLAARSSPPRPRWTRSSSIPAARNGR
jgi:hypothetical protein